MILALLLSIGCAPDDNWYFRTDGVDLPVRVEGNLDSDVVLVMLHGGPKGSGFDYNFGLYTEVLEDAYAMAYFDQRGQGGSHGNFDRSMITIQQYADDTANLVRAIRARYGENISVWLFGHSWGGMLGTATLVDTDVEVDGWIEAAGSHDYPLNDLYSADLLLTVAAEEIDSDSEYSDEWKTITEKVEGFLEDDEIETDESLELNGLAFEAEKYLELEEGDWGDESVLGYLLNAPINFLTASLTGYYPAYLLNEEAYTTSYTDRLDEITVPSLFLYGDRDFVCPPQLGLDAYERVSTDMKDFILYENAGHSLMNNYPREFANDIIDFVEAWR